MSSRRRRRRPGEGGVSERSAPGYAPHPAASRLGLSRTRERQDGASSAGSMADIFFSYSSADRERVRPVRDAFVAHGFEVFWDQEVPPSRDWDSWIREN